MHSNLTKGAFPFLNASFHLIAHKHQPSPGFKPGNLNYGFGVDKSFPLNFVNSKNSLVIIAQTT